MNIYEEMKEGFFIGSWDYNVERVSKSNYKTFYKFIVIFRLMGIFRKSFKGALFCFLSQYPPKGRSSSNTRRIFEDILKKLEVNLGKGELEYTYIPKPYTGRPLKALKIESLRKRFYKRMRQRQAEELTKKYGDPNYNNRERAKETSLEKYGVDNISKSQYFKDFLEATKEQRILKIKETNLKKYGVECYFQTDVFKNNMKEQSLKKYGTEYPSQSQEIKNKVRDTFDTKWGGHPFTWQSTIDKRNHTFLEKYGGKPLSNKDVYKKTLLSMKHKRQTQNKFLDSLEIVLNTKIQREYKIEHFFVDGFLEKTKGEINNIRIFKRDRVILEFLGDYWHGKTNDDSVNEFCGVTAKELYERTFKRFELLSSLGYRILYCWESEYKLNSLNSLKEYKGNNGNS